MRGKYLRVYEEACALVEEGISENRDVENILQDICDLLRSEIDHYDWVGFYIAEESEETLYLGPFSGEPTEHVAIPYGRGICGQAVVAKDVFVVQDVSKETNYLSCSPKVKSEIVVPIYRDGKIIGEIDIDSHSLSPFTDEDREFLEKLAEKVAEIM